MSRTETDWEEAKMVALKAKKQLECALDLIDNFPFSDIGTSELLGVERGIMSALLDVNTIIGKCTVTWDVE